MVYNPFNMGYPYHGLVPAAILARNPQGLTRREYMEVLQEVKVSPYTKFDKEDPLDSFNVGDGDASCFAGTEGLIKTLRLGKSPEFKLFQTPSRDSHGMIICPPILVPLLGILGIDSYEGEFSHLIATHIGNTHKDSLVAQEKPNQHVLPNFETELELQLMSSVRWNLFAKLQDQQALDEVIEIPYDERIKPRALLRLKFYRSLADLYQDYPQFHPEREYDFEQEWGNFDLIHGSENFLWYFKDGKYHFDPETYNRIPASWKSSHWESFGFSDLYITELAIEHGAWKLLSRRGLGHLEQFFATYPEAEERYERACRDAQTFDFGREEGNTIFEVLRRRSLDAGLNSKERE